MSNADRITRISTLIRAQQDTRNITSNPEWAPTWRELEQELLERLLKCGPTDDEQRWRCQTTIEVCRRVKAMFETRGITPASLETELAYLDGSKVRPVA